jgi:hypothetical protein
MRLLVLYLRSRQVPTALAAGAGAVAVLWALNQLTDNPRARDMFGVLAVVAGVVAAGSGLAGADIDLDRTASIAWPPRRIMHVVVATAAVIGLVTAAALTGHPLNPAAQITRDAVGMGGLGALGAATLGAGIAWIPPLSWTVFASTLEVVTGSGPATAAYQEMLTWMFQPPGTASATITAVVLGAAGVVAYAIRGPRAHG